MIPLLPWFSMGLENGQAFQLGVWRVRAHFVRPCPYLCSTHDTHLLIFQQLFPKLLPNHPTPSLNQTHLINLLAVLIYYLMKLTAINIWFLIINLSIVERTWEKNRGLCENQGRNAILVWGREGTSQTVLL